MNAISDSIKSGHEQNFVQLVPHFVLTNQTFYHEKLKPLLSRWILLWLGTKQALGAPKEEILQYLLKGNAVSGDLLQKLKRDLPDESMKMINLSHRWLVSLLPFVLKKTDRVNFGLLSTEDLLTQANVPQARKLLAVPFVGKDVPSKSSEFSHPDVKIAFSILAYRYEGLRKFDVVEIIRMLHQQMLEESGPVRKRSSSRTGKVGQ